MDRTLKLLGFPLRVQNAVGSDGLKRATVQVPHGSRILHLGIKPPEDVICLFALCPPPSDDPLKPWPGMGQIEFVIAGPGDSVPEGYVMRSPVRLQNGVIFLFEKPATGPKLFVPQGAVG